MAQNKDLVADAQTLLEENLSEKKPVESARRLIWGGTQYIMDSIPPSSYYQNLPS